MNKNTKIKFKDLLNQYEEALTDEVFLKPNKRKRVNELLNRNYKQI